MGELAERAIYTRKAWASYLVHETLMKILYKARLKATVNLLQDHAQHNLPPVLTTFLGIEKRGRLT